MASDLRLSNLKLQKPLDDYIQFFETLTPRSVPLIEQVADENIRFQDPFNDVTGIDSMKRVFEKMFEDVQNPKFRVTDYAWGRDGLTAYLRWTCHYERKDRKYAFTGMSELHFTQAGKVIYHIDHWDAASQLYEKIPFLGNLIRYIKHKISVED